MKNKKITIDDLARMVQKGFKDVDAQFEKVDTQFEKVDARFESVDAQFKGVNVRLGNLESGVEEIKLKLDNVPYSFELNAIDNRLKKVETKLGIKSD